MGLLGKLFGGGTDLALTLNSNSVIAGGYVAGKITVTGGKKPLTLTALVVRVFYVHVSSDGDSPLPQVDLRQLAETTVVANQPLPAGKAQHHEFSIKLPDGLDADGKYKVVAAADIPGVKDPKADADLKVITPGAKRGGLLGAVLGAREEDILARYPGLLDEDEQEQVTALYELQSDAYGEDGAKLVAVAPFLLQMARTGPVELRDEALEVWATVLNNRARPSDIRELEALAGEPLTDELRRSVVIAATKFADEGAGPLLARLAQDGDPVVREQVARSLYLDADEDLEGRLAMITALTGDREGSVRAQAAAALGVASDDPAAMQRAAELATRDPSPEVRAASLEALTLAHHHGMLELVVATFQSQLASPSSEVRRAIAGRLYTLPADPRIEPMVRALFADGSQEVRRRMAWSGVNMEEHPALAPLFRTAAERDPDEEVRAEAVYGMRGFLAPGAAIAYARQRFAADPTKPMAFTLLNIASSESELPEARELLIELTRSPFAYVASSARDRLASG